MILRLFLWLAGTVRFTVSSPTALINCLADAGFSYYRLHALGDKGVFEVLFLARRKAERHLAQAGLTVEESRCLGSVGLLRAGKKRVGLLMGLVCMVALPLLSGQFLWQIDVVGNRTLSDGDVLAMLAKEGVFEGAYVGNLDTRAIANRCVMNNGSLAWMALNRSGNRLEVDVVEYADRTQIRIPTEPSNVVAGKSGVIRRVELLSGVAEVHEGQVVNEGTLLISGVNLLRNEKYIYQPAAGKVFAETLNEVTVSEPLITPVKRPTQEVYTEKTLIFFTKSKKIKKYSGNLPALCDRIEEKERIMLFGKIPLPLWIHRVEYRPFVYEEEECSREEAGRRAAVRLGEILARGELLSCSVSESLENGQVILTARYRMIEDIGENQRLFE